MSKLKKAMDVNIPTDLDKPTTFKLEEVKWKSEKQFELFKLLKDESSKIVFIDGVAGTGKGFISIYAALQLLKQHKVTEIIYARKAVECSESSIGFLPGLASEKLELYMQPLEEKLSMFLTSTTIKTLKTQKKISAIPINFLRGVDWQNKCVIVDEFQNLNYHESKTILTRIGEDCKVFAIGDRMQSDIGSRSAFPRVLEMFEGSEHEAQGIFTRYLTEEDIVRSGICRHITKTFSKIDKLVRTRDN